MTDEQDDERFYRDTERIAFPKLDDHQLSLEAARPNVVKPKTTAELIQQVQDMYNDFHTIGAMDREVKATDFWQLEP